MAVNAPRWFRRLRRAAPALCVCLVASCSVGDGGDADSPSGDRSTTVPAEQSDEEVVESYVAAMAEGDIEGAQAYRCAKVAIATADLDAVADQMRRMITENGPLTFSRSEVDPDPLEFDVLDDLEAPVVLRVWVSFGGEERSQPLLLFIGTDDGERRICGYAQARSPRLVDATEGQLVDLGTTPRSLAELVAVPVPEGFTESEAPDAPQLDDVSPAPIERLGRVFQHPSGYGGVTVTAQRFSSAEAAQEFSADRLLEVLGDAVGLNVLAAPAGAFAVEVAGFNSTFLQPADTWPVLTRTLLIYNDVVVAVQQSPLDPDGPDDIWLGIVAAVDAIARPTP